MSKSYSGLVAEGDRYDVRFGTRRVRRGNLVDCRGCIRKGIAAPAQVRKGYQCNTCADLEEGVGYA